MYAFSVNGKKVLSIIRLVFYLDKQVLSIIRLVFYLDKQNKHVTLAYLGKEVPVFPNEW